MIIPLGKWLERLKFAVVFLILTSVLYFAGEAIMGWLDSDVDYGPPQGKAEKVIQIQEYPPPVDVTSFTDRLRLFYQIGE